MNKGQGNLQDLYLNVLRRDNTPVTIYLVNGFQLKGVVRGFDNFTVVLDADGKQQMIYKHAISTIMPFRPVNVMAESKGETNNSK
ncbi:MAG: host factor-I protein [Clostridia bacterium]|nr:host factor-I protein [Clostridia bacterium]